MWKGSMAYQQNLLATKHDELDLIPWIHMVQGNNLLQKVVLWHSHLSLVACEACVHVCSHTHLRINK